MPNRGTILVAEDSELDIILLQLAFEKSGVVARLRFVRDGEEAIDYLSGQNYFSDRSQHPLPHVLLLDLKMPKLDGFGVLTWRRSQPSHEHLPVVVLSSSDEPRDVHRAYQLGANSFVIKPLQQEHREELARLLHHYWVQTNVCPRIGGTTSLLDG